MEYTIALLIIFIILQVFDAWTTMRDIKSPFFTEGNNWLKWVMDKIGILPALIISKIFAIIILCIFLYYVSRTIAISFLALSNIGYILVVLNNYSKLRDKNL